MKVSTDQSLEYTKCARDNIIIRCELWCLCFTYQHPMCIHIESVNGHSIDVSKFVVVNHVSY